MSVHAPGHGEPLKSACRPADDQREPPAEAAHLVNAVGRPGAGSSPRRRAASCSGATSLMKAPITASDPARYLSLVAERWTDRISMCRYASPLAALTGA